MKFSHAASRLLFLFLFVSSFCSRVAYAAANSSSFKENFEVSWAPSNVKFLGTGGEALQLVLDQSTEAHEVDCLLGETQENGLFSGPATAPSRICRASDAHDIEYLWTHPSFLIWCAGSGFASKESYLFGNIDMQIKLIPGDSAGTVTAYYLSSEGANHDELDFEFLGNTSGEPYVLQTNVFSAGVGGREQRINLWFDPTLNFHTYSVQWSPIRVVFLVDAVPIRVFSNIQKTAGVPYLSRQPMRVFSSIWNGDSWATRGGLVKIDWAQAPFIATYRNFRTQNACLASNPPALAACSRSAAAAANHISTTGGAAAPGFDRTKLQWVKQKFMVYDYCSDSARYNPAPAECSREP